eukprot:8300003-Alexandrium_andersonii.AAC.1
MATMRRPAWASLAIREAHLASEDAVEEHADLLSLGPPGAVGKAQVGGEGVQVVHRARRRQD